MKHLFMHNTAFAQVLQFPEAMLQKKNTSELLRCAYMSEIYIQ
jgi:hypothetical protein